MWETVNVESYERRVCYRPCSDSSDIQSSLQARTESGEKLEHCDASRLRHLLRCRLAWYGLRSVEVGSFRLLTNDAVLVDLLEARGVVLCRVEVDRQSGVIKTSTCHTLSCLLASERRPMSDLRRTTPLFVQ